MLHELEVYQIELEMQVRELNESRSALEESHERYINLYDFAPVGYVTLSEQGMIREINLTAAEMLGVARQWLHERSLAPWIMAADLPLFRHASDQRSAAKAAAISHRSCGSCAKTNEPYPSSSHPRASPIRRQASCCSEPRSPT